MTATTSPRLSFDRYVTAIGEQTDALASLLGEPGVDLQAPVPSCPGWNLAQLTQHVAEELRWLTRIVATRATEMLDDTAMRDLDPQPDRDAATTATWIREGARALVSALREAGPDAAVWAPLPGLGTGTAFYARRFAHEQVMHRFDAVLAVDPTRVPDVPADLAVDGLAEWMELGALPEMLQFHPHRRDLLGAGRVLRLTATDHPDVAWLVDLTGDRMVHRPATDADTDTVAVELRGPVVDLLLVVFARRPLDVLEVHGDRALAAFWLERVEFA